MMENRVLLGLKCYGDCATHTIEDGENFIEGKLVHKFFEGESKLKECPVCKGTSLKLCMLDIPGAKKGWLGSVDHASYARGLSAMISANGIFDDFEIDHKEWNKL